MAQQKKLNHTETNTSLTPAQTQIGEDVRDGIYKQNELLLEVIKEIRELKSVGNKKQNYDNEFLSHLIAFTIYYMVYTVICVILIKYSYPRLTKKVLQFPTPMQRLIKYTLMINQIFKMLMRKGHAFLKISGVLFIGRKIANVNKKLFSIKKKEKKYIYIEPERKVSDILKRKIVGEDQALKQFETINLLYNFISGLVKAGFIFFVAYALVPESIFEKIEMQILVLSTIFALTHFYSKTQSLYVTKRYTLNYSFNYSLLFICPVYVYFLFLLSEGATPIKLGTALTAIIAMFSLLPILGFLIRIYKRIS